MLDKRAPKVTLEPNENYWNPARMPQARFVFDNVIPKDEALKELMDSPPLKKAPSRTKSAVRSRSPKQKRSAPAA